MIDDFLKSVRAAMYERTTSPLAGAVALSWLVWNYKFVIVLFSSMEPEKKFGYIEQVLYPRTWGSLVDVLVGPLCTAALLIFVYPFPAKWTFKFWRNRQRELKEIRQQIDDETPLSREEARRIRRQVVAIQAEYERQLQRAAEEEERLKGVVGEEQERVRKLEHEIEQFRAARVDPTRPRASDDQIRSALVQRSYRLNYYSTNGARKSKVLLFGSNGDVLEGKSDFEHSWRVSNGRLETLRKDGRVHGRFDYFPLSKVFLHTNEPDTLSSKGQYLIPEDEKTESTVNAE